MPRDKLSLFGKADVYPCSDFGTPRPSFGVSSPPAHKGFFLQVKGAGQAPRPVGAPSVLGLSGRHCTHQDTYQDGCNAVRTH